MLGGSRGAQHNCDRLALSVRKWLFGERTRGHPDTVSVEDGPRWLPFNVTFLESEPTTVREGGTATATLGSLGDGVGALRPQGRCSVAPRPRGHKIAGVACAQVEA